MKKNSKKKEQPSKPKTVLPKSSQRVFLKLAVLSRKNLILKEDLRLEYLEIDEKDKEERLAKDKIEYLNYIVEKAERIVETEHKNQKMINETTGIGEFGENLAAKIEDLKEEFPNLPEPILEFFGFGPRIGESFFAGANMTNTYQAAFGEILEVIQSMSKVVYEEIESLTEAQDLLDSQTEATESSRLEKEAEEKSLIQTRDEARKVREELAEIKSQLVSANDAKTKLLNENTSLMQQKVQAQAEVHAQEVIRDGLVRQITILEKRAITPIPAKEDPEPNTGDPQPGKQPQKPSSSPQQPEDNASQQGESPEAGKSGKNGVIIVCKKTSCINHVPGKWNYMGKKPPGTKISCPRCGTTVEVPKAK